MSQSKTSTKYVQACQLIRLGRHNLTQKPFKLQSVQGMALEANFSMETLSFRKCLYSLFNALTVTSLVFSSFPAIAAPSSDNSQAEDIAFRMIPEGAQKEIDKESGKKRITFKLKDAIRTAHGQDPIDASMIIDGGGNWSISDLRQEMNRKHEELKRQMEFARVFLNLPKDTPLEQLAAICAGLDEGRKIEMARRYRLKNQSASEMAKGALFRPMGTHLHSWSAQSVLFAIAIGNVMYLQLLTEYGSNPLSMEQHLQHLKDPIAHVAFYSFMAANGFTSDLISKKFDGIDTKGAARMRMAAPYLGMSAGMLASSFTAEVLNSLKICAKTLLAQKNDPQSVLMKAFGQKDPCDEAKAEFFNFENKVEQYIPMILSMMSSTGMLMVGHIGYFKGKSFVTTSKLMTPLKGKKIFQEAAKMARPALSFVSARLAVSLTPVGWAFHSITIGAALGSLAQNTGFIGFDFYLNQFFTKIWAQFWRAGSVDNIDEKLKAAYDFNQKNGWDGSKTKDIRVKTYRGHEISQEQNIIPLLTTFQQQMDAWRLVNHQKFFMGVQLWTEISSEMLRELQASEVFYNSLLNEIFNNYKYKALLEKEGPIADARAGWGTNLPFRAFPLYGINPDYEGQCLEPAANEKADSASESSDLAECPDIRQQYWFNPDELAQRQRTRILNTTARYRSLFRTFQQETPLKPESKSAIDSLLKRLLIKDDNEMGHALLLLNRYISSSSLKDDKAKEFLVKFRQELGNPHPIFDEGKAIGYLQYALLPGTYSNMPAKTINGYKFGLYSEYLLYQMLCGSDAQVPETVLSQSLGFRPKYYPPSIVNSKDIVVEFSDAWSARHHHVPKRIKLCQPAASYGIPFQIPFDDLYSAKFYNGNDRSQEGITFIRFLASNLKSEVLGNWTDTSESSTSTIYSWWTNSTKAVFAQFYDRMDKEFQSLLAMMVKGLQSEALFGLDSSGKIKRTKASRGLLTSSLQEIQVYLTLMADIELATRGGKITLPKDLTFIEAVGSSLAAKTGSQYELVEALRPYIEIVRNLKIVDNRVELAFSPSELKDFQDEIESAMKNYAEHLKSLKLDPYRQEITDLSFQGIHKTIVNLSVYLTYTQLTNFSALESYQSLLDGADTISAQNKDRKIKAPGASPYGR